MTAYYLHIDFRTASGALAWFDGVVEAPNLQAAVAQAEENHRSLCQPLDRELKRPARACPSASR
jgi:hypothetical protein